MNDTPVRDFAQTAYQSTVNEFYVKAAHFGAALGVLQLSQSHRALSISAFERVFDTPFRLRQYKLYCGASGMFNGLATWAWASPHTLAALRRSSPYLLHPSEWNEGEMLCIVDLVAPAHIVKAMVTDLLYGVFVAQQEACLVEKNERFETTRVRKLTRRALERLFPMER